MLSLTYSVAPLKLDMMIGVCVAIASNTTNGKTSEKLGNTSRSLALKNNNAFFLGKALVNKKFTGIQLSS